MWNQKAPTPAMPATLEDTGLSIGQVEQLLVKTLYNGELTGLGIADQMRLAYPILEPLIERLRAERLIEVRGAAATGTSSYRYALTDLGRERAQKYLEASLYVGPAPVPLAKYVAYMSDLMAARGYMDRDRLAQGFGHLIISDKVLEQLGPAVNAGKAVFLYGAPGNGKTVIAEGMGRTLGGDMFVPHAIDVDGHVVTMYDPIIHHAVESESGTSSVIIQKTEDRRWVRIRRPVVMVGGELTLDMLDLRFNPLSKFYEAPIQLKANGGVFLVDDFGRQKQRPQDLLNRWIVPLESRIDFLTLHTGKKFQVPFDVLSVFATNLDPDSLADEAFLRRIPYKIPITDPSLEEFTAIFELNCRRRKMRFHGVMVAYLMRRHYAPVGRALRACHPRDLLDQITALCRYRGIEPAITRELIDAACESYFVSTAKPTPAVLRPRQASAQRAEVH
jgi:DNA-binding MarR family transcriptional regulator